MIRALNSLCRRATYAKATLLGALLLGLCSAAMAEDYVVVANKSVGASSLSKADAQAIFLGDKTKWDDGKPIDFAVMDESDVSKAFLQDVVGKTPAQFDNYWKRLVFTGKGSAPKSFGDAHKVLDFVSTTPGAIGYVPAGKTDPSVKTISVK